MADVFTKAKRSEVMARIRSRGNRDTELALLALLRAHRLSGWRRHVRMPGTPDFVFAKQRVAVFVDGCFWHCCPRCSTRPSSNREFWETKLAGNRRRDIATTRTLRAAGWAVIRIWEHSFKNPERVMKRLRMALRGGPKEDLIP